MKNPQQTEKEVHQIVIRRAIDGSILCRFDDANNGGLAAFCFAMQKTFGISPGS
jgi:hypothetical protein